MDKVSGIKDSIGNSVSNIYSSNEPGYLVLKVFMVAVVIIILIEAGKRIYKKYKIFKNSSIWILKGTKSGKKRMVITQNPGTSNSVIGRSDNERAGLEFTYSFWMYIDDWSYRNGEWKHVMHKGNDNGYPLRAPGIWLHPKSNSLRVYMNTFKSVNEFVDIDNIPINKWFHVVVAARQRNLDIIINGNLAKRKELEGIPKQNDGDLYINSFRGFSGYMSNIKYFDYYISFMELEKILNSGPSSMPCVDSKETPPYLSSKWWINA
jgi:hypothetical protein